MGACQRGWCSRDTSLPDTCYHTKFRRSRSNRLAAFMEIFQKILTPCVDPLSDLSRSHKVIGTDTDRSAAYEFLLLIYSNHGPMSSEINGDFRRKSHIFLTPLYLIPRRRSPPTRCWKEFDDIYTFVSIQYQNVTDRQTDRRTDGFSITISRCARIGMLTRDKNHHSVQLYRTPSLKAKD